MIVWECEIKQGPECLSELHQALQKQESIIAKAPDLRSTSNKGRASNPIG
ncbi:hypothetical protein TRE132_25290 [Pseudomonas chlororaphis subsp. aurantiaca]|nr:hypothetical protein TRE132_25290 [Pseudomonas chlororaphis subsp. aurantiaca]